MAETKAEVFAEMQKCLPQLEKILHDKARKDEHWHIRVLDRYPRLVYLLLQDSSGTILVEEQLTSSEIQHLPQAMQRLRDKAPDKASASPEELEMLEAFRKACGD